MDAEHMWATLIAAKQGHDVCKLSRIKRMKMQHTMKQNNQINGSIRVHSLVVAQLSTTVSSSLKELGNKVQPRLMLTS